MCFVCVVCVNLTFPLATKKLLSFAKKISEGAEKKDCYFFDERTTLRQTGCFKKLKRKCALKIQSETLYQFSTKLSFQTLHRRKKYKYVATKIFYVIVF